MTDSSTEGIKTVLHPVSDVATAKTVYTALLGVPPQTDGEYYVGFDVAGQHIGLLPGGGPPRPDLAGRLLARGGPRDEVDRGHRGRCHRGGASAGCRWGRLVLTVTDPNGNVLGLLQDR